MSSPTQTEAINMTAADPGPDQALFDEAIEAIQKAVSDLDGETFQHHLDLALLVRDLQTICDSNVKEQRKLMDCARQLTLFARAFAPYFDVLGICVEVRPDWLSWFWGMLRLLFKVGSNYTLFLEKVAGMFETISHILPRYQHIYEKCKNQTPTQYQSQDDRLTTLLSYVYADIIQFCLDLYRLFHRGSQGGRLRYICHLSTSTIWRPLDSRFKQLRQHLGWHKRWLEFETEKAIQDYSLIERHRREYVEFLNYQIEANSNSSVEGDRMARRLRRVDKVKKWLSNCYSYRDVYEHKDKQRHPNSCTWFLRDQKYCCWKNSPFVQTAANNPSELERDWHDRILFVQGEPGFGKTFISGSVIDDLNAEAEDLNISDEPPTTAFFHFSAVQYCKHPSDAFRALTYQLVQIHRHDRSTLDALCLLMRRMSNHEKASSDDVLAILSLLLRQHATFLLIDGIDECNDIELFLTLLPEVCRKSDTRVILFSRPNIRIPLVYQKWASNSPHVITLDERQHAKGVADFLTGHLSRMADQGFFGISMDRTLIPRVATKSRSGFLWASLLVKYLQFPGLSSNERRAALENFQDLEGLDSIYRAIFALFCRLPHYEKRVVKNTFRWLSHSIHQLGIPAFQTALTLMPGRPITESDYLPSFDDSIARLTCGLVEVTKCSVLFIHRSVKDHLQSPAYQNLNSSLFDEANAHAHLAAHCLSYLAYDIPKRPLIQLQQSQRPSLNASATSSGMSTRTNRSGDSGYKSMSSASDTEHTNMATTADTHFDSSTRNISTVDLDANLPFFRYASLCWPIHLTRALTQSHRTKGTHEQTSEPFQTTPWLPILSRFLSERTTVLVWVEASWRYNLPPNLSRLIPLLSNLKAETPPASVEGKEIRRVVQALRELSDALVGLKDAYGTTLRENPGFVWQWRGGMTPPVVQNGSSIGGEGFEPVWEENVSVIS